MTQPIPPPPVQPAAPQSPPLPSPVQLPLSNPAEDDSRHTSDLNRCLKEAVDAIFSPSDQADDVTLIKVVKQGETEVIKPQPVPDDDVKIELVKQDVAKPTESAVEEFDPVKVLEWKDGVGSLPGSDLKVSYQVFKLNNAYFESSHYMLLKCNNLLTHLCTLHILCAFNSYYFGLCLSCNILTDNQLNV